MLKVSNAVKNEYFKNTTRYLNISISKSDTEVINISPYDICQESMVLKERLLDKKSVEYVGCNASVFKITINGLHKGLKGKKIEVFLHTENTVGAPIPLFHGVVDDMMYSLADEDVTSWFRTQVAYLKMGKKLTVKKFRNDLFVFLGIAQKKRTLANDSFSIKQLVNMVDNNEDDADEEEQEKIYALDLIKAICQINGVFGVINRNGEMDYRRLGVEDIQAWIRMIRRMDCICRLYRESALRISLQIRPSIHPIKASLMKIMTYMGSPRYMSDSRKIQKPDMPDLIRNTNT